MGLAVPRNSMGMPAGGGSVSCKQVGRWGPGPSAGQHRQSLGAPCRQGDVRFSGVCGLRTGGLHLGIGLPNPGLSPVGLR